jgi:2-polyprenyl-3-methyl-5-hydroxy-6-metoxy-1,4-benzoquinol methylase
LKTRRLTHGEYWDAGYSERAHTAPLEVEGFRSMAQKRLLERIEALGLRGRRVLEVGAGNSALLTHLARKYGAETRFSGLDYSANGCQLLAQRAAREGVRVEVLQQDLFDPDPALFGAFDVIYSLGVVEHFSTLEAPMSAIARMLHRDGRIFTMIPNMAGVLGTLTRRYNPEVYDLHVAHDLASFVDGHRASGLYVESSGYLCSNNFGVLSSCFSGRDDDGWRTYLWLSRLTKAVWFVENAIGELPHSSRFSPYIYAVSRHSG